MSTVAHEINLALRTAAGHERTAYAAEVTGQKQYAMKMASAGASAYSAFVLAIKAAPEYQGRKIDDAAIRRIYKSTRVRPWWDVHLRAVKIEGKPADREWGKRLIQWHLDPMAAQARHVKANVRRVANHVKTRAKAEAWGEQRSPQARDVAPNTAEMRTVARALQETALAGWESPETVVDAAGPVLEDLLGEVNRISAAVRRVGAIDRSTVLDILRTTAREVERYVP
jgi:hypothetical protein